MDPERSRKARRRRTWLALCAIAALGFEPHAAMAQGNAAQDNSAPSALTPRPGLVGPDATPFVPDAAAPPAAADQRASVLGELGPAARFSDAELRKLLAPIALYPDPLLAQVLRASAYPLQIVLAHRWLNRNLPAIAKGDYSGVDAQSWEPSVKALCRFPEIIKRMSDDLEWTIDLGDAEANEPQEVARVIQGLRAEAKRAGTLLTTPEQIVTTIQESGQTIVEIEPAEPGVIYVPSYDWGLAYGSYVPLIYGPGIGVGAWWARGLWNWWNWRTGAINVWAGRPGQRPPYPGWRPGLPDCANGACSNVELKPWRPGADYRPGLGSKPALGAAASLPRGLPFGLEGAGGPVRPGAAQTGGAVAPRLPFGGRLEPPISSHFEHIAPPVQQFAPHFERLTPVSPPVGQAARPFTHFAPPMSPPLTHVGPPGGGLAQPGFAHPAFSPGLPMGPR